MTTRKQTIKLALALSLAITGSTLTPYAQTPSVASAYRKAQEGTVRADDQDEIRAAKVGELINSVIKEQNVPGISVAVVRDGQIVLARGYGYANLEHQVPVKPETIFQSGSVGKQFTATAVMMLVEDGKIDVDEKISKYLRQVPESWKNMGSVLISN